jgi:hypothetical protein
VRPGVGDPLNRCEECGCWEYGGAPECPRCRALVDQIVESAWREFLRRDFADWPETTVAEMVVEEPQRHDWRVLDAAMDRLTCPECGSGLGRGPRGCHACDLADGNRHVAIETDRPGVPPGNEHAIRVNVAVVRRPDAVSPAELLARRALLSALLVGALPTTREAQAISARVKGGLTYEDLAPGVLALAHRVRCRHD